MIDYQIHDVSEKELKFGSWLLANQAKVKKILVLILLLFCVITVGYGIFGFLTYALEFQKDKQTLGLGTLNFIDFAGYQARNRPQDLEISEPQVIYNGGSQYDFVAQAKNPNERRGAEKLLFQFVSGDFVSPVLSAVILPGQSVYLLSLGNFSQKRLTKANLNILDVKWQSLRSGQITEKLDIKFTEPKFNITSDNSHAWISFTATNESLKNIWEVVWQAVLFSGRRIVAVNQITSERFLSGESRQIEMSWFEKLPKVTQIIAIPIVNIYNEDNFFEIPAQAKEPLY